MVQTDVIEYIKRIAEQEELKQADNPLATAADARTYLAREILQKMGVSYGETSRNE